MKTGLWTCHKNKSKQVMTCNGKSGRVCADTEEMTETVLADKNIDCKTFVSCVHGGRQESTKESTAEPQLI